jgi:hypothetical protein
VEHFPSVQWVAGAVVLGAIKGGSPQVFVSAMALSFVISFIVIIIFLRPLTKCNAYLILRSVLAHLITVKKSSPTTCHGGAWGERR